MGHRFDSVGVETLSGNRTLTQAEVDNNHFMSFDPGGSARNLVLPAEADNAGNWLFISNTADGAEVLTIQDDTPATVCTPTQNEDAIVWCDGTSWFGGVLTAS
ncbi:MAG: hypothetical protein ACE5E8_11385 [Acidimicrobiia bacterium]